MLHIIDHHWVGQHKKKNNNNFWVCFIATKIQSTNAPSNWLIKIIAQSSLQQRMYMDQVFHIKKNEHKNWDRMP